VSSVLSTDLIDTLSRPEFYPDRPARVEVRETHISWVFLAGERAYKLKKPLVLAFLDYGTAERRRRMCDEEVRLNRRLAGDIYVGVRSVATDGDGFRLAAREDPEAVDYLVEMRRYEERSTLAARLERIRPSVLGENVDDLARLLARFHAATRKVARDRGGALAVRRRVDENFRELRQVLHSPPDSDRVRSLERFTDAFLTGQAAELDSRARAGLVVEGHGDLRAEHVLVDDAVRVVDCIEFDPRRRELDVADELSFLVMDLTMRGAEDLARRLVASYRDAGGDPGEAPLIAFYACFRALVRTKVALLRAAQLGPRSGAEVEERASAKDLLGLSERFAWQARLPLVIAVCGAPATGKTTLAGALARTARLRHLSSDVIRKRALGIAPHERAPLGAYSTAANRHTYTELGRLAAAEVARRHGAIVDATFRHRADRAAFLEAFGERAPLLFVECSTPFEVTVARARHREGEPGRTSDASERVVLAERHSWEPLDELELQMHVTLDGERPLAHRLADVQAHIDSGLVAETALATT
jgi:uncharacterized protein